MAGRLKCPLTDNGLNFREVVESAWLETQVSGCVCCLAPKETQISQARGF